MPPPKRHTGTLTDDEIKAACANGELIVDSFEPRNVKQACYELRASRVYHTEIHAPASRRVDLDEPGNGDDILIRPHELVVVIAQEELSLPPDVLGRVLSKGQLVSLGLVPVNTYADPGFQGQLGIVLLNASTSYLRIKPGEAIAKLEFSRLAAPVARPYHGQHGYSTKIWPLPGGAVMTPEQVSSDPRIGTPHEEIARAYGPELGSVVSAVFGYGRTLLIAILMYILVATLLLALMVGREERFGVIIAVVAGVAANAVTQVVIWRVTRLRNR